MERSWGWIAGGIFAVLVGLTLWYTAFVLVPLGLILVAVGTVKALRVGRA